MEETEKSAAGFALVSVHPAVVRMLTSPPRIKTRLWYQLLEFTATLTAGELGNASEYEGGHRCSLLLKTISISVCFLAI